MKLYTIVGRVSGAESSVYGTYTDLETTKKCLETHIAMNRKYGEFEQFDILENELEGNHKTVYRVIGFDGGICIHLLGICDTLDNADKFIIEIHEELEKNNIDYPYYDVEEIEL
jgi:hypothetical protein